MSNATAARQLALQALRLIYHKGAYTDMAIDRVLQKTETIAVERNLVCELVYGVVRRQRTLDCLIDYLGKRSAAKQPPLLRIILHLGLYQLRYLQQIPDSAAVNTSVELAKVNNLTKLAGVVNGILRGYLRQSQPQADPLLLPREPIPRLGILHSFPDWIVDLFLRQWGYEETDKLLDWYNQSPYLNLRINRLKTNLQEVKQSFIEQNINFSASELIPFAIIFNKGSGAIKNLPGFSAGWWTVQDRSAQLVTYLLDPKPGETIIDACAAPGGKTTHIAELMGDKGEVWAIDRDKKRLRQVKQNCQRLGLSCVQIQAGDSSQIKEFKGKAQRVLLDAPCSGLGTLHKRPDIRWRQTPEQIQGLVNLQTELLANAATWVKPGGILVYATCTLNPEENEGIIKSFLARHQNWQIVMPNAQFPARNLVSPFGWIKILPHKHQMDGFFMVKLQLAAAPE